MESWKKEVFSTVRKDDMPKKKIVYKDIPSWDNLEPLVAIQDFLPEPKDLVFKPRVKKVTLTLSEDSVDFFKEKAEEFNTSYQPMIRNLLDEYTRRMRS